LSRRSVSSDGTVKLSFADANGRSFETCILNLDYRPISRVVCVSTQIGCPFDCLFCAVGQEQFVKSLASLDISHQISAAIDDASWGNRRIRFEVAAMGTGEPLCHLDEVVAGVRRARADFPTLVSLNLATVGLPDGIKRYARVDLDGVEPGLQLSLHAANDEKRALIMPSASRFKLSSVVDACRDFAVIRKRRVTVNYLLIQGINDAEQDALKLCDLLEPEFFLIKLSILNQTRRSALKGSSPEVISRFKNILSEHTLESRIFESCGSDISAGCGQFSNNPWT
jgi:23S rRNA (adenine2503-C2)-methyltransferase